MKILVIILLVGITMPANAQSGSSEIQYHYQVMKSLWQQERYDSVVQYAKKVEPFFEQNNKFPTYDYYHLLIEYLAPAYYEANQYEAAEAVLTSTLGKLNKSKINYHYFNANYHLGILYFTSGRYTLAHKHYSAAWQLIDLWGQVKPSIIIRLGCDLITTCANMGKYDEIPLYEKKIDKAISTFKYTQDDMVDYYTSLAVTYAQMMSMQKVSFYLSKLNGILSTHKLDFFRLALIKNVESMVLVFNNRLDAAESVLLQLLSDIESNGFGNTDIHFMAKYLLVNCYSMAQKAAKADSLLNNGLSKQISLTPDNMGFLYMGRALLATQQMDYPKALSDMDSSISFLNTATQQGLQATGYAHLNRLAILLKLGKKQAAVGAYNQFMATYMPYIRSNISYLSEIEKNNVITSDFFEMTRAVLELLGKDKPGDGDSFIQKVWSQMIFFRGLAVGEQTKLYNMLRQTLDTAAQKLYIEWLELKHYLQAEAQKPVIARDGNLESLAVLAEKKEKQLAQYLPRFNRRQPTNVIPNLYSHLRPGEALVDFNRYMRFTTQPVDSIWYGAFVLVHGKPKPAFINVCAENNIALFLNNGFRDNVSNKALGLLYPPDRVNLLHDMPGNYLYTLLWKPLQPYLAGIHTVYVVADGLLHKIALHALPLEKGGYLCDKINIRYLSHCNRLAEPSLRKSKQISGIQLWGGIQYHADTAALRKQVSGLHVSSEKEWDYLPGTLREVESIGQLARSRNIPAQVFSGGHATEQSLKQQVGPQYDILHMATHGQFDTGFYFRNPRFALPANLPFAPQKDPMRQVHLIMAGRNALKADTSGTLGGNEGLLDAGEIARLNLSGKQLVTLSACESGLGNVISAEGVFGMTRAFTMAGAEKIIISLWDVKDATSAEMMQVFYGELFAGKPVAASFKTAQQYMRKKYPPYYWAGFVLIE